MGRRQAPDEEDAGLRLHVRWSAPIHVSAGILLICQSTAKVSAPVMEKTKRFAAQGADVSAEEAYAQIAKMNEVYAFSATEPVLRRL